jgi:hypothetical protein
MLLCNVPARPASMKSGVKRKQIAIPDRYGLASRASCLGSRYRSGRSKDWLKSKNPDAPAVKREAEEEWG